MLKDIPYSVLKQDERAYDIMLLRDLYNNTFTDIASVYEISSARVLQIYNQMKRKQMRLYRNHIAIISGHRDTSEIEKVYNTAYECYHSLSYVCAYLEKKYNHILTAYRDGEPGMPAQFIKHMPPFQPQLSKKTTSRIIEMRETEKASFTAIAKELRITQEKARHEYDLFYHKLVLKHIKALQDKATSIQEKDAIWEYYFEKNISAKKRYDMLISGKSSLK